MTLGCRTLHELYTGERETPMMAEDVVEWMAYHELEPWGETRMDWRFGQLCAVVANLLRGKDDPASRPADWVPDFDGSQKGDMAMSAEESRDALRSLDEGGGRAKGGTLAS